MQERGQPHSLRWKSYLTAIYNEGIFVCYKSESKIIQFVGHYGHNENTDGCLEGANIIVIHFNSTTVYTLVFSM